MKNLFEIAEACLHNPDIDEKLALTHRAKWLLEHRQLDFTASQPVMAISEVKFAEMPILQAPRHMPRRNLTTQDGVIAFFHAIAHVEFMAIYLAWDLLYRFRGLPEQFYQDWLIVADEEATCLHMAACGITQLRRQATYWHGWQWFPAAWKPGAWT